jgi:hypothetical protein
LTTMKMTVEVNPKNKPKTTRMTLTLTIFKRRIKLAFIEFLKMGVLRNTDLVLRNTC